jgi:hypothetical protein
MDNYVADLNPVLMLRMYALRLIQHMDNYAILPYFLKRQL